MGFSKAMSNGWIMIDKADGGKVKRKVADIKDGLYLISIFKIISK